MSKFTFEIQSRVINPGPESHSFSELFEMNLDCKYSDDGEVNNDFTVLLKSDIDRIDTTSNIHSSQNIVSNLKGSYVAGTRVSDTIFTRTSGVWVEDELKNWYVYAFNFSDQYGGSWFPVSSNTTTSLAISTASGVLPASCNFVALSPRQKFRHNIQLIPKAGQYGSNFYYKVTKKIPVDGVFDWLGCTMKFIPLNIDPEFTSSSGSIDFSWE